MWQSYSLTKIQHPSALHPQPEMCAPEHYDHRNVCYYYVFVLIYWCHICHLIIVICDIFKPYISHCTVYT